ncbi:hypothetical protein SISSUDRAFT_181414 [Sistotremastrum suecicum HHB10207 ss-3]|uniref:Uncharacterized protein n=1 Tax=Sistotremastrum suecicum HHB10207 ss-3 TaxID=1314776 RepID=A0A166GSG6_9AGAM|nr:hypothetical protein SISSUDRAFT_181414 [Sistotremastrum suecicum HHB10207 ss-3]
MARSALAIHFGIFSRSGLVIDAKWSKRIHWQLTSRLEGKKLRLHASRPTARHFLSRLLYCLFPAYPSVFKPNIDNALPACAAWLTRYRNHSSSVPDATLSANSSDMSNFTYKCFQPRDHRQGRKVTDPIWTWDVTG